MAARKTKAKTGDKATAKKKAPAAKKKPAKKATKKAAQDEEAEPPVNESKDGGPVFRSPADVHILVVDDEPDMLGLLVPFLSKAGYSVTEAADGDQALEQILIERPNIVLLDVNMPGLDGWQIAKYVRDRPYLKGVRIIMATGIGANLNEATAPLFRADGYLNKPFTLDEVERAVREVILRIETEAV